MRAIPVCLSVSAVLIAGCSASSSDSAKHFKGDARLVAGTVDDLQKAGQKDQPKKICDDLLAKSLLARLRAAGTNCHSAVGDALKDADNFDISVDSVRITGTRAVVRVTSGKGSKKTKDTLLLEREGADWKISSLGS